MPQKPNMFLRVVVPIILALGGIGIGIAVFKNTGRQGATSTPRSQPASGAPAQPASPAPPQSPAGGEKPSPSGADTPSSTPPPAGQGPTATPAQSTHATTPTAAPALTARTYSVSQAFRSLGSLDPASGYEVEVTFSRVGAGLDSLTLTNEYVDIYRSAHENLQRYHANPVMPETGFAPFGVAGVNVSINGGPEVGVPLLLPPDPTRSYWEEKAPGVFEAVIVDAGDTPILTLTRSYEVESHSHDLILKQTISNLGDQPVSVRWNQFGPVDLPVDTDRPGMDKRRIHFGYLNSPQIDPTQQIVDASKFMTDRHTVLGKPRVDRVSGFSFWEDYKLWPSKESQDRQMTLAWAAMTGRHFGVVLHPLVNPTATNPDKSLRLDAAVHAKVLPGREDRANRKTAADNAVVALTLESRPLSVSPGGAASLDLGIYAGPLADKAMSAAAEPRAAVMELDKVIVYTLGGPCAFCTFQSVTGVLYWWLTFLHDYLVHDYAIGIMLLVVCMRVILHPVTRHSQISMQRFSKQMQALAPKQKKIQERYANDPQKVREEMARLMREEHISYTSMAQGCLTPFLQTPVWIALYAMLFFMYELRHTPAFFGVFQWLSQSLFGAKWAFLADLSEPDRFIPFGHGYSVPLMGVVDSINVLPILLGVVFFMQQKYLTPPPTTPLTPEQQQQQKIMKVITVLMFPLFMYTQPSALTLYFVVNSTLGIFESRRIRRHAEKMDLLKPPAARAGAKAEPAKPGFFARLQAAAEAKQKELERRQKETDRKKKR